MSKLTNLTPSIRLSIKNPDSESGSVFGRGIADLCLGVREKGSLNAAAKSIGMAYSKAWRIIKQAEEGLDVALFLRQGARGSCLTDEARALIELYRRVERETKACANRVLRESVDELVEKGVLSHAAAPDLEKKATPELIAQVRALGL